MESVWKNAIRPRKYPFIRSAYFQTEQEFLRYCLFKKQYLIDANKMTQVKKYESLLKIFLIGVAHNTQNGRKFISPINQ